MIKELPKKMQLARKNKLKVNEIEQLINEMIVTKDIKRKCSIAISLSYVKKNSIIINPILNVLSYWKKSEYSGFIYTTYARLLVNYYKLVKNKFINLLYNKDKYIRKVISHSFCYAILADGVDTKYANILYKKNIKSVLIKYLKKEKNKENSDFIKDFLNEH